jgi:hypothetical protein
MEIGRDPKIRGKARKVMVFQGFLRLEIELRETIPQVIFPEAMTSRRDAEAFQDRVSGKEPVSWLRI